MFSGLLDKERIDRPYIDSATAQFYIRSDLWPGYCLVEVSLTDGKRVRAAVGIDGRKAEILTHDV
jgi:hypothetical protein